MVWFHHEWQQKKGKKAIYVSNYGLGVLNPAMQTAANHTNKVYLLKYFGDSQTTNTGSFSTSWTKVNDGFR